MAQTAKRTIVTMSGRTLTFVGDEADAYFRGLEAFHNGSPQFENFIRVNLGPDATCVDVGANIGLTAALLATYCPNGRVYALEASPKNACYLRENVARNGLDNCVVIETAIGNRSGSLAFLETGFGAGSHVLSAERANTAGAKVIPVASLDSLFAMPAPRRRIDFVKLDVEGFEPVAISGAARLIERDRCIIFMEFNSWCLQLLHEFNPFVFARALAATFDLATIRKDGEPQRVTADEIHGFMYRNIMQQGCVDDVVLRLKDRARVPPLAEMIKGADDLRNYREVRRLRGELKAARDARFCGLGRWLGSPDGGTAGQPDSSPAMDLEPALPRPAEPRRREPPPSDLKQRQREDCTQPEAGRNMHIQLLRALAILFVLGAHLSITNTLLMQLPFAAANPGWIGVELFFVVSGCVVLQSFARAGFSVTSFAARRIFRLYPLLIFFLATTVLSKAVCDALVPAPPPLFSPSFEMLSHQTLAILLAYHPTAEWGSSFANSALWSLSVELRFYAALAIFVAILNLLCADRLAHRRKILIAASSVYATGIAARILICFGVTFGMGDLIISKMYDFIALGTIVALLPASVTERLARTVRPVVWALLPAPLALVMVFGSPYQNAAQSPTAFNLAMIAIGLMFALLVLASKSGDASPRLSERVRAFGNFLGDRSYALFLLHLPVFNIAWALGQSLGFDDGYWKWPLFQLVVSAFLLPPLVEAAHRWIELPMIELGKSAADRLQHVREMLFPRRPIARPAQGLRWERVG